MATNQDTSGYIDENVGIISSNHDEASGYIDENLGITSPNHQEANGYIYEEVIPLTMRTKMGVPI